MPRKATPITDDDRAQAAAVREELDKVGLGDGGARKRKQDHNPTPVRYGTPNKSAAKAKPKQPETDAVEIAQADDLFLPGDNL
jgi:hypothetical protein